MTLLLLFALLAAAQATEPTQGDRWPTHLLPPGPPPAVDPELWPGQPAPALQDVPLLGGGSFSFKAGRQQLVVVAHDPASGFSEAMWTSEASVDAWLVSTPPDALFLFATHGNDLAPVEALRALVQARLALLPQVVQQSWSQRLFFSAQAPVDGWLARAMAQWGGSTNLASGGKRLDAQFEWLPGPAAGSNATVVPVSGGGCDADAFPAGGLAQQAALVEAAGGDCSWFERAARAQAANASVLIVRAAEGRPLELMACDGAECDVPLSVAATMVPHDAALTPEASFATVNASGTCVGVSAAGALAECGYLIWPTLQAYSYHAQYGNFLSRLDAVLAAGDASGAVQAVRVFDHATVKGNSSCGDSPASGCGPWAVVDIPAAHAKTGLQLDMALSCPGPTDAYCAPWDHVLQVRACCAPDGACDALNDGFELGRWITPFHRGVGHWLSDVTALAPLLDGPQCNMTAFLTAWWADPWVVTLDLRFDARGQAPLTTLPVFVNVTRNEDDGVVFNETYNVQYASAVPRTFEVPPGARRVVLETVISGHGASVPTDCCEFAPTTHVFTINGGAGVYEHTYAMAGTEHGCEHRVPFGGVPNELGTWNYGRSWCDGRAVYPGPTSWDITSAVDFSGVNSIDYEGLENGEWPAPESAPGYIILHANIAFYGSASAADGAIADDGVFYDDDDFSDDDATTDYADIYDDDDAYFKRIGFVEDDDDGDYADLLEHSLEDDDAYFRGVTLTTDD